MSNTSTTNKASSLLASLTGGDGGAGDDMFASAAEEVSPLRGSSPDQDLFGDIPIDGGDNVVEPPPKPNNMMMNMMGGGQQQQQQQQQPPTAAAAAASMLQPPKQQVVAAPQPQLPSMLPPQPPSQPQQSQSLPSMLQQQPPFMPQQQGMMQQQQPPPSMPPQQPPPMPPQQPPPPPAAQEPPTAAPVSVPTGPSSMLAASGLLGTAAGSEPTTTTTVGGAASSSPPTANSSSMLAASGLLGDATGAGGNATGGKAGAGTGTGLFGAGGGGGDGLFDDIDREEEAKVKAQEEQRQRQLLAEQQRKEQEEAQARQLQEQKQQQQQQQELQRQQQQLQQQQQQLQQQQQNQIMGQMQNMNLNGGNPLAQGGSPQQQQQQMMQQQPQSYGQQQFMQQQPQMGQQQQQQQPPQMGGQGQFMQQPQLSQASPYMQQQPTPQQQQSGGIMYRDHHQNQGNNNAAVGGGVNSNSNYPNQQQQQAANSSTFPNNAYNPSHMNNNNNKMPPSQIHVPTSGVAGTTTPGGSPTRFYPGRPGTLTAGMHNVSTPSAGGAGAGAGGIGSPYGSMGKPPKTQLLVTKPPPVQTLYSRVIVSEPLLIQGGSGGFLGMTKSPPYWSYQITTQIHNMPHPWMVRRRFRHVVALEDRLRNECPGAILPPRPDKHATRAIEEATALQSAEFAKQRANELEVYLNHLVKHPVAWQSTVVRLFLSLQDDLGVAWPEVSSNAFTRFGAVGVSATMKLAESTSVLPNKDADIGATEDSAEILALWSSESLRMGAVCQAVPKLEGAVTLFAQHGEGSGAVGMEFNKMAKDLGDGDRELSTPIEILSNGLLRQGRRTKRLGVELSAAMAGFGHQYKLCRYEKLAFMDRKAALQRRLKERSKADSRAQQLMMQQHQQQQQRMAMAAAQQQQQHGGVGGNFDRLAADASLSDEMAISAVRDCEEIGETLKREVNRVAYERRMDWGKSIKVIVSAMKESSTESIAIWESTRKQFLQSFPDAA